MNVLNAVELKNGKFYVMHISPQLTFLKIKNGRVTNSKSISLSLAS